MGKYKIKAIQTDLGTFTHILAYSDISRRIQPDIIRHIQTYSEPCLTLTYSETWYIQNLGKFRTRDILKTLAYSEPWFIQNPGIFMTRGIFRTQKYLEP